MASHSFIVSSRPSLKKQKSLSSQIDSFSFYVTSLKLAHVGLKWSLPVVMDCRLQQMTLIKISHYKLLICGEFVAHKVDLVYKNEMK